ncbi:NlpC/P60 family protein [Rhodococcus sp. NPDC058521]|uniref:C40 family peptidase n=1 Tax=Rhodococcus sp. NPDC058521 TaxID=3346536 RepID=UPI003654CA19
MSVDAAAIIVAITTAAGAIVQGADIPQPVKDQAVEAVQNAEQASPDAQKQVEDAIAALPDGARQQAEQMVGDFGGAVEDATDPYIPEQEKAPAPGAPAPALPPPAPRAAPGYQAAPPSSSGGGGAATGGFQSLMPSAPSAVGATGVAGSAFADIPGLPFLGALGSLVPAVPAGFPGVSLAPVGAIAVFAPWIRKAGSVCEGVKPATLAALYSVGSGFRYGAAAPTSPAGARGPGQFTPEAWTKYGKDADGDGKVDILGVADPVMASGNMLCDVFGQVEALKADGALKGDSLDLTLAAYDVGMDAVRQAGGVPAAAPGREPQPFVARVRSLEESFDRMLAPFFYGGAVVDGVSGVIDAAMKYIGLPYVWGGGSINGPSMGGFDCSGLTSFAVYAATGIKLPRTSETQWRVGVEVPLDQARPGDLLFGNWGPGGPGHVAIYLGNGQMLHAPTTGDVVRVGAVFDGMKARRIV